MEEYLGGWNGWSKFIFLPENHNIAQYFAGTTSSNTSLSPHAYLNHLCDRPLQRVQGSAEKHESRMMLICEWYKSPEQAVYHNIMIQEEMLGDRPKKSMRLPRKCGVSKDFCDHGRQP